MHQQAPPASPGMSPDSDDEQQTRAWAKSSVSAAAPSTSSTSRSAKSPLAVSVSGPAFRASALEPVTSASQVRSNSIARMASASSSSATSAPPPSLKREFRGKCLYQSRKCENERALKRNGKAHNLCDEHRSKQNQHQRKFDAKKFSRKRRRGGSSGDGQSGDDDDDDEEEVDNNADGDETMNEARRRPEGGQTVLNPEALKPERESSPPASRTSGAGAEKPQRKIRRFDGAKHAGRRPRHEMETTSQQPIKSEVDAMGGMSVRSSVGLARPQYVSEQYREDPVAYQRQQSREYPPLPPPHGYSAIHSGPEQQHHQSHLSVRELEQSGYYHPAQETRSGIPGTSSGVHPSPRNSGFAGRPLRPLRSLSAIVSTPTSRIPVENQQEHPTGERAPTPEQMYRQVGGRERRHTDDGFEARARFSERRASYDGGSRASEVGADAGVRVYPHQYQAERSSYLPGRYPTAPEASGVRLSSPHALETAYAPQYSQSELMAASILVPGGAAPVSRQPQYTEPSAVSGATGAGAAERGHHSQHQHTSVSPRGMPPMYYPSSYAISPHHARLQPSGSSSASYLRAQQQMQISAERERRDNIRNSSELQRRHSPPSAAVSPYASASAPPPRMLPSLATQVAAAISSAPAGSAPPPAFSSKPAPTPRGLPPAREFSGHHYQQYHQHDDQAIDQHHHQQSRHHHPVVTPTAAAPVLSSLPPFRSFRDPSKASREQLHYSTPASR